MSSYQYETHLHTSEVSACSVAPAVELVHFYKKLGYAGIFVTDHFVAQVPPASPARSWAEHIESFCHGYEVAAREGREVGLDVFLGWEYSHGWAHFLTYGLDKAWLLAHPDLGDWDWLNYFDRVHEAGGFIVHAHPLRERVDCVQLVPRHVDAIEIFNGGRPEDANRHALDYANSFGLRKTAGSDIHSTTKKKLYGMRFPRRLTDANDFISAVKAEEGVVFCEELS